MKKITATILSLLTLTAAFVGTAAGLCAQKSLSANAIAPAQPISTSASERLIAPRSYEEYLTLNAPTDVAATDGSVAISDGNDVYLFEREGGKGWQRYTHTHPVTKLHFAGRNELYFLDDQTKLYKLQVTELSSGGAIDTGIVCSTFTVNGGFLYYNNVSAGKTSIRYASLSNLAAQTVLCEDMMYSPAVAYWNGEVYYLYGSHYLYRLSATNERKEVAKLPSEGVSAMTIEGGNLYCVTERGSFYGYSLSELSEKKDAEACVPFAAYVGDGYTAISAIDGEAYLVRKNTVKRYSTVAAQFTGYEIGASSDSAGRFHGASEALLSGNTLFVADDKNDRISTYDVTKNAFTAPISTPLDNPFLAADEKTETLLAASGTQAILYRLDNENYGEIAAALDGTKISGNVVGATCVFDTYYVVTDTNHCYIASPQSGAFAWTEQVRKAHAADSLASDDDGFLYVRNGDSVYRYTEETFLSSEEKGVKLLDGLPFDTDKIAVDYGKNLYALAGGELHRYTPAAGDSYGYSQTFAFDEGFVYGVSPKAISFAFGREENATYILYEGDYLTATTACNLPTVRGIATEQVVTQINQLTNGEFSVVTTKPNALLVQVDFSKTENDGCFPYLGAKRTPAPITALKLAQTHDYALLAYRKDGGSSYETLLVAHGAWTEKSAGATKLPAPQTGYLTNDAPLYKYPAMTLTQFGELTRGTKLTLTGEVTGLDCDYYEVTYGEKVGYVAKSYVTAFNGAPPASQTVTVGDASKNADDIWRLAYILLGSGAICVLVDFLIFRKKKDEDE